MFEWFFRLEIRSQMNSLSSNSFGKIKTLEIKIFSVMQIYFKTGAAYKEGESKSIISKQVSF